MIEEFEDISFENLMDEGFSVITEEIHDKNEQPKEEQESFPILPVKNKRQVYKTAGRCL